MFDCGIRTVQEMEILSKLAKIYWYYKRIVYSVLENEREDLHLK